MGHSLVTALKAAAARCGIRPEEYEDRINAGQRLCRRCRTWRAMFEGPWCPVCKDARNKKQRQYIDAAMEGREDG